MKAIAVEVKRMLREIGASVRWHIVGLRKAEIVRECKGGLGGQ
jgi:hypothetical protein